ncbi:polysaccharide pyruvyl transferase family protein [Pseudooceanicola sp. MF1-13]|uniref:polysaccharide pyruvyl transferase family protein n=1 Tax=Pseudooceanicola sp. MF1-13 TaxID=3379095 RepID=UPI003892652B
MSKLRLLHIASFSGNIGDNANHIGYRDWLQCLSEHPIAWSELEIREFFWRERAWDADFVDYANSFDGLVIGGGNYFELWVENSPTGTSIAIAPELWAQIKVPVYFNALGVDPGQGVPNACRARFTGFLDTLLADDNVLVSVRNDGAKKNLSEHIGAAYADSVLHAPDNGFFADFQPAEGIPFFSDTNVKRIVTMNLASDMAEIRFAGLNDGVDGFAKEIAEAIGTLSERDPSLGFLFAPHIFRDLDIVSRVIDRLPDRIRRTRVAQTPYGSGNAAARSVFGLYAASDLCVGTRFHANVVPIGNLRQTLGLVCYPQISALYDELGQPDRCIDASRPGFGDILAERMEDALYSPETKFSGTPANALDTATRLRDNIENQVQNWINSFAQ